MSFYHSAYLVSSSSFSSEFLRSSIELLKKDVAAGQVWGVLLISTRGNLSKSIRSWKTSSFSPFVLEMFAIRFWSIMMLLTVLDVSFREQTGINQYLTTFPVDRSYVRR